MSFVRPAELERRLESSGPEQPFVLDIRPRTAFAERAIEGSYNIPVYDDLRGGDEGALRERLDEVPADGDVVVVCKMGVVAKRATSVLEETGYEAATLRGGMNAWSGYQRGSLGYRLRSLLWKFR